MPDQAFAPGTFTGATIAFTTATTLIGNVKSFKWDGGITRKEVDTSHLLSTDGVDTFIAGDKINTGSLTIEAQYSTQLDYLALLIANKCDTVTVTFPKRSVTCGAVLPTTAAKIVFTVVILSAEPNYDNDNLNMITFKMKVSGKPVFTAASSV